MAARPLCWAVPGSSTVRRGSRVCLKPGWLRGRCSSGCRHRASLRGSGGAPAAREPPGAGQERKAQNQRGPERCSACPAQSCPPGVRERLATASCRAGPGRSQGTPQYPDCTSIPLPSRRGAAGLGSVRSTKKHRAHLALHFSNVSE